MSEILKAQIVRFGSILSDAPFWPRRIRYASWKVWWLVRNGWSLKYALRHFIDYVFGDGSI